MSKHFDYKNEIEYGREGDKFFVRSMVYNEYIVYADTLRLAFDEYIETYN